MLLSCWQLRQSLVVNSTVLTLICHRELARAFARYLATASANLAYVIPTSPQRDTTCQWIQDGRMATSNTAKLSPAARFQEPLLLVTTTVHPRTLQNCWTFSRRPV